MSASSNAPFSPPTAPSGTAPDRTLLSVDVGNTAAKWRLWRLDGRGRLTAIARCDLATRAGEDEAERALEAVFAAHPKAELAAAATVVEPALAAAWLARASARSRAPATADLAPGLENRTREPARVGRDRLFAARGALELVESSCIVVNVGTAMTVDAVLAADLRESPGRVAVLGRAASPGWPRGAFLGGAIAPGPWLSARALAAGAAQLFEFEPIPDPPPLGADSRAAMLSGVGVGLRGAARELAREIARAAGLTEPTIVYSGGARSFVARAFEGERVRECADLVHLGLCAAALEAAGHPRPPALGFA